MSDLSEPCSDEGLTIPNDIRIRVIATTDGTGSELQPTAVEGVDEQPCDYDAYFAWQLVYLLRALKFMDKLTPIQNKLVEEHAKLLAATVKGDSQSHQQHQTAKAVLDARMDEQERVSENKDYGIVFYNHDGSTFKTQDDRLADLQNQRNALDKETV